MREEQRRAFVHSTVRTHLTSLVREQRWMGLLEQGLQSVAQERLGLAWYQIKADLMLRNVGARRSEILALFEEILLPEHREHYHDLVAYDPDLPQPGEEEVDKVWAGRIREAVREGVGPLEGRLEEVVAAPWRAP